MRQPRPTVFIGSSSEGLPYAKAIFAELETETTPTVWDHAFEPMKATLEQLEELKHFYDYAVLVMTPDDARRSRGRQTKVPRDNVVAELGLFIGALGRSRVFFVKPRDESIALPSDFLGITALVYTRRDDDNLRLAVHTACDTIKSQIKKSASSRTLSDGSATDVRFWHNVADRQGHNQDVRALMKTAKQRVIISGITLSYVVWRCADELRDILRHKMPVGIIIANATHESISIYRRYSPLVEENLPTTHKMYSAFFDSLDDEQRKSFALYHTDVPLTHNMGLFDDRVYVNVFCIDHNSSVCPSFSPAPGSHSHAIFISEFKKLLGESHCICGSAGDALIRSFGVDE